MARLSLESRISKLEKSVEKNREAENPLCIEEVAAIAVSVVWNVKGMYDEYKEPPSTEEWVLELKEYLCNPAFTPLTLKGWEDYAPEEVKKKYPDMPEEIMALSRDEEAPQE